jgi:hypothetical protein
MIEVNIPDNYGSIEELHSWLSKNFHQTRPNKWMIITYPGRGYCIRFYDRKDAIMFSLKWNYERI